MILCSIDADLLIKSVGVLALSVALPGQVYICLKVKSLIKRLLPVIICSVITIIYGIVSFVVPGLDSIGYFVIALCAGILLVMCCVGWVIWDIIRLVKKRVKNK